MDGSPLSPDDLAAVDDVTSLLELLQDKLGWDLGAEDVDDLDDVTYDWGPDELALKPEHRAKLREIKQLRPFDSDQDWAVFFVSFESEGRLPITVLRRVLRGLTLRGRGASADRSAWDREDILFISAFGKGAERELAFAHFHAEAGGDLPRLSVLGWDEADTERRKALTAARLAGLSYEPSEDAADRRERWRAAFHGTKRQAITDSKTLARELATLAARIRGRVNELIAAEDETGHLRRMHTVFQRTLIEGLSADEFADTFAQTVAYGLLTAAFSRASGALVMQDLVHMVPPTNPFLRGLFERFLHMGGQDRDQLLDYDELGLREVIDLLQAADLEAVRADFDSRRKGEDPVIFLYEDFLQHYDAALRMKRGVYYTPRSVVGFIVRGVDEILREEFDLPLGLADTSTWGEVAARVDAVTVPKGVDPSTPFVRILDPATGTGTFLVEAIDLIEKRMKAQWQDETDEHRRALWQDYVERHLLPRLTGFELMMAPYAIAHMKVGLKLTDTGFVGREGMRLGVYLTNALEPSREVDAELDFMFDTLADEARAANEAKGRKATVVIGNPPYSGHSQNNNIPWIVDLVHDYKREWPDLLLPGQGKWLQDDYVKFIRYAQHRIVGAGAGVLGFVTNHSFLDNPTFKGMRTKLMATFPSLRLYDLHGNFKKKEVAPDGSADENVFEGVGQGVSVSLLARGVAPRIERADLWGVEAAKLGTLETQTIAQAGFEPFVPLPPMNLFAERDADVWAEYEPFAPLPRVMDQNGRPAPGIVTTHDEFAISFTPEEQVAKVEALLATGDEEEARGLFKLCSQDQWSYARAKRELPRTDWRSKVVSVAYRPFDERFTVWDSNVAVHRRERVNEHLVDGQSVALLVPKQTKEAWDAKCADGVAGHKSLAAYDINSLFALFLRPTPTEPRRPNVSPAFTRALAARLKLAWIDGLPRASSKGGQLNLDALAPPDQPDLMDQGASPDWDGRADLARAFGPRDLFDYVYAILHAPSYRTRYAEFLRSDFPRVPLPGGADPAGLFRALAAHGRRLTALHLLDVDAAPELRAPTIRLAGTGSTQLGMGSGRNGVPRWEDGKVWINDARWFETVPEDVWDFRIGGYQPAQKWLKDRAGKGGANARDGRTLTDDDVLHYRRFVTAMQLTIPEMAAVDATIERHGGWPDAFTET